MLDFTRLTPSVRRAAHKAASAFPEHHSLPDVEQEIWVWVMENKGTILRILSDSEGGLKPIEELMVKAAREHLMKEDAADYGYDPEDQYAYSTNTIKQILEVVFTHEDWQSFADAIGDGMPKAKSDPSIGGNNLASYSDVSRAVGELSDEHYNLLVWRYKYRWTFQQIGDATGLTRQGATRRHEYAVSAIQQSLGRKDLGEYRRGHDSRREPRGNAAITSRTERDYEG